MPPPECKQFLTAKSLALPPAPQPSYRALSTSADQQQSVLHDQPSALSRSKGLAPLTAHHPTN